eukprot:2885354-Karenia_brevis.AAC.1
MCIRDSFQRDLGFDGTRAQERNVRFNLNYHKTKVAFEQSFRKNFPDMCKDRVMTIIDCTRFRDPDRSEDTKHHTGHHPKTLRHVAESENF